MGKSIHKTTGENSLVAILVVLNYNIKQNATMNVNRSQKHGPIFNRYSTTARRI